MDRPIAVTMILLVSVVLGVVSLRGLPVSLVPDVDIPYVTVRASAPQLAAREMEDAVVKPLRSRLMQVDGLESVNTVADDGLATLSLTFSQKTGMEYAFVEVNEQVDLAMGSLPKMDRPSVMKASATDIPAFYITMRLKDGGDFGEMSRFARRVVVRRLEQLKEVAMVDVTGLDEEELFIRPRMDVLESLGLGPSDLEGIVRSANISLGQLTVRDGEYHYPVRFRSFARTGKDLEEVYFRHDGRVMQLKDVADVVPRAAVRSGLALSDGKDAIVLAVIGQGDARMADLRSAVQTQLRSMGRLARDVEFTVTRDQTGLLEYSIGSLLKSILAAILLTGLILLLFMKDFRSPLLVAATIPASLVISMVLLRALGIGINIISLSGLLLGVGMMVDNSIILVDNVTGRWRKGESLRSSVLRGTSEVAAPMLSSVLTTCAVFIPLVFVSGIAGKLFYDQAMTIASVLLTSWVVTVTALPVYYYLAYRRSDEFRESRILSRVSSGGAMRMYESTVTYFLDHRFLPEGILAFSMVLAVVCIVLMPRSQLPEMEYSDMMVSIDWNSQVTLERNRELTTGLCSVLEGSGVRQVTALVGSQQFILPHSGEQSMREASLYVDCGSPEELGRTKVAMEKWMAGNCPEAEMSFGVSSNLYELVFSSQEPYLLAHIRPVTGAGLDVGALRRTIGKLRKAFPDNVAGRMDTREGVLFTADPERLALYGVGMQTLASTLSSSLAGDRLFEIVQGSLSVPVVMGSDSRTLSELLENTYVSASGMDIPVSALMRESYEETLGAIISDQGGEYWPLEMKARSRDVPSLLSNLRSVTREEGFFDVDFSGRWFSDKEMVRDMLLILLVAVVLLFLILAAQFESLLQPLIILSEVVVDIAASLLFLWAVGVTLNLMSLIGLVVVSGIVVNDSILKIDTINRLRRSGMPMRDAVLEAGRRRLKAIVMTSLTTILSVCPFLSRGSMGADLQFPMSLVIIVGMTVGTAVSLFLVPSLYAHLCSGKKNQ